MICNGKPDLPALSLRAGDLLLPLHPSGTVLEVMAVIQETADIQSNCRKEYNDIFPLNGSAEEPGITYWTWRRLSMFVLAVGGGRTPTLGEWQSLHREIPGLSVTKKTWLYRQLQAYFSSEALRYLFGGWQPASTMESLDLWL